MCGRLWRCADLGDDLFETAGGPFEGVPDAWPHHRQTRLDAGPDQQAVKEIRFGDWSRR
jgi:hypothetical protein